MLAAPLDLRFTEALDAPLEGSLVAVPIEPATLEAHGAAVLLDFAIGLGGVHFVILCLVLRLVD
jgi:hypothetical protein